MMHALLNPVLLRQTPSPGCGNPLLRANEIYQESQRSIFVGTDHLFAGLLFFQWIAAIVVALILSPLTWAGASSAVHPHVWTALILGGITISLPKALALRRPGQTLTRHIIAIAQMVMSGLLIHVSGGRIETHFHVFGSLAFLAFYRDWRVLVTASIVTVLDHVLRGLYIPLSIYGVLGGTQWRWAEHSGWVVFEDIFLIWSCRRSLAEMSTIAERQAALEVSNAQLEITADELAQARDQLEVRVQERTHELEASRTDMRQVIERANCLLWTGEVRETLVPQNPQSIVFDPERHTFLLWDIKVMNQTEVLSWLLIEVQEKQPFFVSWVQARHPEDYRACDERSNSALREGVDRYTQAFRNRLSDGTIRWLQEDVRIESLEASEPELLNDTGLRRWRLTGIVTDITERKHAEDELRESERRFGDMLRNVELVSLMLDAQGQVTYCNDYLLRLTGWRREEMIGRTWIDLFVPPESREELHDVFAALFDNRPVAWHHENEIVTRSGTRRLIRWNNSVLRSITGEVIGTASIGEDITERKRAEEALQQAHDQLESRVAERTQDLMAATQEAESARREADRANLAKSEFLSRMSHELRTPLNAILGFGQILERQDLPQRQRDSVQYILSGGRHLLALIDEILDIARVEAQRVELAIEPIKLDDLVAESWALLRPLANERDIKFNTVSTQAPLFVRADRQRLKQVLINLLSNAIKYNREGGTITVTCEELPDARIRVTVQDTGLGISPENLHRLFIPFERLDAAQLGIEGTGLGLVLSRGLMKLMGGTLEATSMLNEGSAFCVVLPQVSNLSESAEVSSPGSIPEDRTSGEERSFTVLCIEDQLSNLRLIEAILETRPSVHLLVAMQGSIGLDLAHQHGPDLILLDLNLPDLSGQEVLSRLQHSRVTEGIPVVIISADATAVRIERLLAAGAAAYLTKPLDVSLFLQKVDTILQHRERTGAKW